MSTKQPLIAVALAACVAVSACGGTATRPTTPSATTTTATSQLAAARVGFLLDYGRIRSALSTAVADNVSADSMAGLYAAAKALGYDVEKLMPLVPSEGPQLNQLAGALTLTEQAALASESGDQATALADMTTSLAQLKAADPGAIAVALNG